jgi:uroporphyrinogen decarboxylase
MWLMRQAGRYLPEYRAVRAQAGDFLDLCFTPTLAAEVTLQPLRRFGMDAAILFSDILVVPYALGQGVRFAQGEGPVLDPVRTMPALMRLRPQALAAAVAPVLETVRLVAASCGEATLIGFAGSPFTVACYMIEGGGSKDFAVARGLAYREPGLFGALMALLEEATGQYLEAQVEAGAEALMLFDSWAGLLPPEQFAAHVIEPTARLVARLARRFPAVPVIGFARTPAPLHRYAVETGVQGLGLDTAVDPHGDLPTGVALQGNLDPVSLLEGGEAMRRQALAILHAARGRPWIFNLGHGVLPATPPEHVEALVGLVRRADPAGTAQGRAA